MGFAVVADEVRNLAQRSAQAAKDTAALIEESIARSQEGAGNVEQVASSDRGDHRERRPGEGHRRRGARGEPAADAGDRSGVAGDRADGAGDADDGGDGGRERRGERGAERASRNVDGGRSNNSRCWSAPASAAAAEKNINQDDASLVRQRREDPGQTAPDSGRRDSDGQHRRLRKVLTVAGRLAFQPATRAGR